MAILVTGVGRGIGRAIALAFAVPGATVAIAARTPAQLEETARAIEQRGAKPLPLALDVTDEHAVARAFEEIEGACGSTLEVLVNNAGVGGGLPIHKTGHRELAPHPRDECVGHVSRVAARRAADARRRPDHQHVVGARTVRGARLHRLLRVEARGDRIHARPRARARETRRDGQRGVSRLGGDRHVRQGMRTGATMGVTVEEFKRQAVGAVPINRMIQPEEVANLVKFLASPGAAAITGQTYNICGGQVMS